MFPRCRYKQRCIQGPRRAGRRPITHALPGGGLREVGSRRALFISRCCMPAAMTPNRNRATNPAGRAPGAAASGCPSCALTANSASAVQDIVGVVNGSRHARSLIISPIIAPRSPGQHTAGNGRPASATGISRDLLSPKLTLQFLLPERHSRADPSSVLCKNGFRHSGESRSPGFLNQKKPKSSGFRRLRRNDDLAVLIVFCIRRLVGFHVRGLERLWPTSRFRRVA